MKEALISKHLNCARFEGSHTADAIHAELTRMLNDFSIREKVVCVTADNAQNEKKAIKDLGYNYIGCYAHTLNLVVQDSIKSTAGFDELRDKVAQVVSVTRRSPSAKDQFEDAQRKVGCQIILKLLQHVPHRWNSLYQMFNRFVQLKPAIILFLSEEEKRPEFTNEEWGAMKGLVTLLKPLYDVTTELCAEKHTTVSKIIPLTKILRAIYSRREQKDKTTMDLEKRLLSSITIRFEHVESAHALSLATLLDPRYKGKGFERPEKIARAVQLLKEAAEFENKKHPEGSSQCASSLTSQAKRVKFDSR